MPRWETAGEVTRNGNRFEWKVDDRFFLPPNVESYVGSPTFIFSNSLWYLTKWPYGWAAPGDYNWMGLSLCGTSSQCPTLTVRLGIMRSDGRDLKSSRGRTSPYGCFEEPRYMRAWQVEKRRAELSRGGLVTVFCEVRMEDGDEAVVEVVPAAPPREEENTGEGVREATYCSSESDELPLSEGEEENSSVKSYLKRIKPESKSLYKLLKDFENMWLTGEDSDITIKIQGKELSAHKNILRARCPVFHSMFKHKMVEETSGVVEIDDCDPDSFRDFLHYIYTGYVENFSVQNVFSLFEAADKYCVEQLKDECLEFIKASISLDTFCDTMILSLRYSEAELLEQANNFFSKNMSDIIVTERWESFLHENTTEGNKLLIKALVPGKPNA